MKNRVVAAVSEEIAREKAEAFGRSGRAVEAALAELRAFDARTAEGRADDGAARARLVARAAERVLHCLAQREACGLRDPDYVFEFYAVPSDVIARLGARPASRG